MKSKIKIAFVTAKDPRNRKSFSGIYFQMLKSLESEFEYVLPVGPIKYNFIKLGFKCLNVISKRLFAKGYDEEHNILVSKYYAWKIKNKLKNMDFDVIFAPAASTEIAYLKTTKPIFYFSDTSFNQIKDYYGGYSNLIKNSIKEANLIEKRALLTSTAVIHSSTWASDYVVNYYGIDRAKTYIVKMGANIDEAPSKSSFEQKLKINGECNLLFIGVDWERKGGAIAFDTLLKLNELGLDTKLTICGCIPPTKIQHPKMTVIPFLDKNDKKQYMEFLSLLNTSHFFIMPSRAECTAIALCEASAYGIPSITTDTGGISSIIENGVNGYMLSLSATGVEYAAIIKSIFDDKQRYRMLVNQSRKRYEDELNWKSWGIAVKNIILNNLN